LFACGPGRENRLSPSILQIPGYIVDLTTADSTVWVFGELHMHCSIEVEIGDEQVAGISVPRVQFLDASAYLSIRICASSYNPGQGERLSPSILQVPGYIVDLTAAGSTVCPSLLDV